MIPLEKALAIVDREMRGWRVSVQTVPIREATDHYLAADQQSKLDLPAFDKSLMDGYAILKGDVREEYRLVGVVAAGEPGIDTLEPGTTVKVMTGAPVPAGTGKVVMVEQAIEREGRVRLEHTDSASHIRVKAKEVAAGQTILKAGTRLEAVHIASLISCGISEVEVYRQLCVTAISTGDELVNSVADITPGKIMNSNGPMLSGLARQWGMAVVREDWAPDDRAALRQSIDRGLSEADLVVLTGGVSAGDFDYVPEVIIDCGLEIHFSRVAARPGKPTTFATGEKGCLFGLPGNPVAAYMMFHLFVLRAAALLSGSTQKLRRFTVRTAHDITRRSTERAEFCPCRILDSGVVERVSYHGSAHLSALMEADGFLFIPQGVELLLAGAKAEFVMLSERSS
ncbi:MAG: molybdopterin molybdotransferase MoeA [Phycisphaerales bacterium]|nr:MAG: molybdopterin molybdotransferase MoeA [Phycisphaerales bacterium]